MSIEHAHLFRAISNRAFHYFLQDLDTLRSKVNRLDMELSRVFVARMDRRKLVDTLTANDFGTDAYISYKAQCLEWDRCQDFCNGK